MDLSFFSSLSSLVSLAPNSPFMACSFLPNRIWPWTCCITLVSYVALVQQLRYRRRDSTAIRYSTYIDRFNSPPMPIDVATAIIRDLAQLELSKTYSCSIFFALFKTYAIPSISHRLLSTRQPSTPGPTQTKRMADTAVLLTEIFFSPASSTRHANAVAHLCYLHDGYRRQGLISDDDMLYTLSLFALEPGRWSERFDFRGLTDAEKCATGVFFRKLGQEMDIPFPFEQTEDFNVWNGLAWLEALEQWSEEYEFDNMEFSNWNKELATRTLELALINVPRWLKPFVKSMMVAAMEPQLRIAMGIPHPSESQERVFTTLASIRKFILRHLCLPRRESQRVRYITEEPDPITGRYHVLRYRIHPWYVKPTFRSRWGFRALCTRFLWGGVLPGDDDIYRPEGYRIEDLGPAER